MQTKVNIPGATANLGPTHHSKRSVLRQTSVTSLPLCHSALSGKLSNTVGFHFSACNFCSGYFLRKWVVISQCLKPHHHLRTSPNGRQSNSEEMNYHETKSRNILVPELFWSFSPNYPTSWTWHFYQTKNLRLLLPVTFQIVLCILSLSFWVGGADHPSSVHAH